jgi:hypothetical protein
MYALMIPDRAPEPSGTRTDRTPSGPAPAAERKLPPPAAPGPPADWPKDVHLPDEGEEAEC